MITLLERYLLFIATLHFSPLVHIYIYREREREREREKKIFREA